MVSSLFKVPRASNLSEWWWVLGYWLNMTEALICQLVTFLCDSSSCSRREVQKRSRYLTANLLALIRKLLAFLPFPMVPPRIVVEWFYFIPVNHPRPFEGTEVHEARRLELHLGVRTAVRMFDPISILALTVLGFQITWSILSQLQKARPLLFWEVLDQCTNN